MYSVICDGLCIHDSATPLAEAKLIDPKLTLGDNSAGSFTFTLPPSNIGYNRVGHLSSEIVVKKKGVEIWSGRVINEDKDFWNNRKITCEGELAYLNDTTQPPAEYHIAENAVATFLGSLLAIHNQKATSNMRFVLGAVTVNDDNDYVYRYTNYESTLQCIKEKLIDKLGGHLRIRKIQNESDTYVQSYDAVYKAGKTYYQKASGQEAYTVISGTPYNVDTAIPDTVTEKYEKVSAGTIRYLDYLADYPQVSTQSIEFGQNLMDFTTSWDMTELATVVVPLGKQLEESSIEKLTEYLTVKDAEQTTDDEGHIVHAKDSIYVQSHDAIRAYGWIETVVHWDDVETVENLLAKGTEYLKDAQFESMTLEISAVDLHYLNPNIESFNILDEVLCRSKPHGMDRRFPITKMEIPLDKPEDTVYTMGDKVKASISASVRKSSDEILEKMEESDWETLRRAKQNAAEIINSRTRGYITIVEDKNNGGSQELIISDTPDISSAQKMWVWNLGGLGYFNDGRYNPDGSTKPLTLAMTMDGQIVADYITTGTMAAERVRTGILEDENKYNYWDLTNGVFKLSGPNTKVKDQQGNEQDLDKYIGDKSGEISKEDIFNKLTDNGANTGVFRLINGEMYINATYINSGTLSADRIDAKSISTEKLQTGSITDMGNGVKFGTPISATGLSIIGNVYFGDIASKSEINFRAKKVNWNSAEVWCQYDKPNGKIGNKEADSRYVSGVGSFVHGLLVSDDNIWDE